MTAAAQALTGLEAGDHLCWVYESDRQHRALVPAFLADALKRNNKVLYLADAHPPEIILDYLRSTGVDAEAHVARGALVIVDAASVYLRSGSFEPKQVIAYLREESERALREGYTALCATGESDLLLRQPLASWVDYERGISGLVAGTRCMAVCQYDRRLWRGSLAEHAIALHPRRRPGAAERYSPEPAYGREAVDQQQLLRRLFDNLPLMIAFGDASGRVTFANREWLRVLGWSADDACSRDVMAESFPDEAHCREMARFIAEAGGAWREFQVRARDGRVLDICCNVVRLDNGTRVGIGQDMTAWKRDHAEWRRSEQLFRSLVENTRDLITVMDAEGCIRYTSPAVREVLGYEPAELIGSSAFCLVHPDDMERVKGVFDESVRQGGSLKRTEYRLRHRDGSWRVLESAGENLLGVQALAGVLVTSRDVTERRELESQLLHAQRMEAVGEVAGGLAHEFSNLLSVILCYSDLMLNDVPEPDTLRGDVEQIRKAADRAADITKRLLTFSRGQPARRQALDLNELVTRTLRLLGPVLGEPVALQAALAGQPVPVNADAGQIEQVLLNLALNARDAMPGGGVIRIQTKAVELSGGNPYGLPPGGYALLRFSDTGTGMDRRTQARAFEPFFTTKERGRGTGLGLSMVYGIVRQHEGAVMIDSEPGRGTTFRICLPRAERPQPCP